MGEKMDVTTRNSGKSLKMGSFELRANNVKDDIANDRLDELFKVVDKCVFVLNTYKGTIQSKMNTIALQNKLGTINTKIQCKDGTGLQSFSKNDGRFADTRSCSRS